MLGTELMPVFAALGPVSGMDIEELDITDPGQCSARMHRDPARSGRERGGPYGGRLLRNT